MDDIGNLEGWTMVVLIVVDNNICGSKNKREKKEKNQLTILFVDGSLFLNFATHSSILEPIIDQMQKD